MSKDNIFEIVLDITLEFNDTRVKQPLQSGCYLVVTRNGMITELYYNKEHNAWNWWKDSEGVEHSTAVEFWAHYNTLLNELVSEARYRRDNS